MTKNYEISEKEILSGRYQLLKEIATGGMGTVFLAKDLYLEKKLALKLINAKMLKHKKLKKSAEQKQFLNEYKLIKQLYQPYIIKALSYDIHHNRHFYTMEHIEGKELSQLIKENSLSFKDKASLMLKILRAVEFLHEKKIVFRDLKPDNILVKTDLTPVIIDFGLAEQDERKPKVKTSTFKGSLDYSAPELFEDKIIDKRIDIFSLGIIFLNMFRGYESNNISSLTTIIAYSTNIKEFKKHHQLAISEINDLNVQKIIRKMIAYDREKRYQNCSFVIDDFSRIIIAESENERINALIPYSKLKIPAFIEDYKTKVLKALPKCAFVVIGGPKKAGKSTILKEIRNDLLLNFKNVLYVNCTDLETFHPLGPLKEFVKNNFTFLSEKTQNDYKPLYDYYFTENSSNENVWDERPAFLLTSTASLLIKIIRKKKIILLLDKLNPDIHENLTQVLIYADSLLSKEAVRNRINIIIVSDEDLDLTTQNTHKIFLKALTTAQCLAFLQAEFSFSENDLEKLKAFLSYDFNRSPGNMSQFFKQLIERNELYKKTDKWCLEINDNYSLNELLIESYNLKLDDYLKDKIGSTLLTFLYCQDGLLNYPEFLKLVPFKEDLIQNVIQSMEEHELITLVSLNNEILIRFSSKKLKSLIKEKLPKEFVQQAALKIARYIDAEHNYSEPVFLEKLAELYFLGKDKAKAATYLYEALEQYKKALKLDKIASISKVLRKFYLKKKDSEKIFDLDLLYARTCMETGKINQALKLFNQLLDKTNNEDKKHQMTEIFLNLSFLYKIHGDYNKALHYGERAEKLALSIKNKLQLSRAYGLIGIALNRLGKRDLALKYHKKRLKYSLAVNDLLSVGKTYNNISVIYNETDPEKAIKYSQKFYTIAKKLKYKYYEIIALGNLGAILQSLRRYKEALEKYTAQLKLAKEYRINNTIIICLANLESLYRVFDLTEQSLKYSREGLKVAEAVGNKPETAGFYLKISEVYFERKLFPRALFYANKALVAIKTIPESKEHFNALYLKCLIYREYQKDKKYYSLLEHSKRIRDKYKSKNIDSMYLKSLYFVDLVFQVKEGSYSENIKLYKELTACFSKDSKRYLLVEATLNKLLFEKLFEQHLQLSDKFLNFLLYTYKQALLLLKKFKKRGFSKLSGKMIKELESYDLSFIDKR